MEIGRQVPHIGRSHQCRHARRRQGGPCVSAPKASVCSAPSTCSTAPAPIEPLFLLRKMILSKTVDERKAALAELFPVRQEEHEGHDGSHGRAARDDPPVGSAVARVCAAGSRQASEEVGQSLGHQTGATSKNAARPYMKPIPMMGHRGVRLGITYPECHRDAEFGRSSRPPPN